MAHIEDASKLLTEKDVLLTELATPGVELDEDDCYYTFIRLYAPDVRLVQTLILPIITIMPCTIS